MGEDDTHINLRVPKELRDRAAALAKHERRSLNNLVLVVLEWAVESAETGQVPWRPR